MNPVLRGVAVYIFLLVLFRLMGKRSLSESTTFDLVLLLIISETTQQALVGRDYSLTGAFVLILTLITSDIVFTFLREKSRMFSKVTQGVPLVIVENGKLLEHRAQKCKVDKEDVLEAARLSMGLENLKEIKYAILEIDGTISIIPYKK